MSKIRRPSKTMKNRFRAEKKLNRKLTMKAFARRLVAEGDEVAEEWLYNKSRAPIKKAKEERWERKGSIIILKRQATKLAKRRRSLKRQGKDPSKVKSAEKPTVTSE